MTNSDWLTIARRVKTRVEAALTALAQNPLAADRVSVRNRPFRRDGDEETGVFITPVPDTEVPVLNVAADVGYGVGVVLFRKDDANNETADDVLLQWVEEAKSTLRLSRDNPSNVYKIEIEPRTVIDPAVYPRGYSVASFVARCYVRRS